MANELRVNEVAGDNFFSTGVIRCSPISMITGDQTLTQVQMAAGLLISYADTSAVTYTFPPAKIIKQAFPGIKLGEAAMLFIRNLGSSAGAITLAADSGATVTLAAGNTAAIAISKTALLLIRFTNVTPSKEACTVYLMYQTTH